MQTKRLSHNYTLQLSVHYKRRDEVDNSANHKL